MEDTLARIITEIEDLHLNYQESQSPTLFFSKSTLLHLLSLLDTNDPGIVDRFFDELASRNLSPSFLLRPISAAMDSGPVHISLLSSDAYLSLLLSPNSPVFSLFTPMSFVSLLHSIRRSLKHQSGPKDGSATRGVQAPPQGRGKKRRRVSKKSAKDLGTESEEEDEEGSFDIRLWFRVMEKLASVPNLVHLDRFPDSLKSLVQTVCEIPVEFCGDPVSFDRLMDLCSLILCQVLKSDSADTASEVLKSLAPLCLMGKSQARSFGLGFISKTMVGLTKESDGVKKALVSLPKYLVHKAPEKAEYRGLAVDAIMEIVKALEFEDQMGFVQYVVKMAQGKANLRFLAVDLIPLLISSLRDPLGDADWGLSCLDTLIDRCSDSTAGIRARALSNLTQVVGFLSTDDKNRQVLRNALGFSVETSNEGRIDDLLRKRCVDEKALVRKSALILASKLTALLGGSLDSVVLKMMGIACSDPLVSIRKAAISALSEAFRKFSDENVSAEWLQSVPRLITDNEISIQEECENLFLELVLERVSRAGCGAQRNESIISSKRKGKSFEREIEMLYPEGVLSLLKGICNAEVAPCVKKICTSLGKKKKLKTKIAVALQTIIKESESLWLSGSMPIEKWSAPPGAWLLLSEVSTYLPKAVEWEFLRHHWELLDKNVVQGEFRSPRAQINHWAEESSIESNSASWAGDRVFLLQTISNVSVELPPELAADLAHKLLKRIEKFNMHSTEVNAHVKALRTLCKRKALNLEMAETVVMQWVEQLLSKASEIVEIYISGTSEGNKNDSNMFTPLTSGGRKGKKQAKKHRLLAKTVTAVYTIGSVIIVCPSADISHIVPLLHTIITSGNSSQKSNKLPHTAVSLKQTAPALYIQAWLTMGKICLADGKLAKRYIPLFAQELEKSDCASLRNNLVVMMADFCVHYTALVDCYITKITKCLGDSCELVRRQTFILLARLLQRDYVKWRGVLFFRFLLSLVDDSEKIRQLADFLFGTILKAKSPLLAYNSFVEAIYILNDCRAHNGHNDSNAARTGSQIFSIKGNDERSRSKRMHIYMTLLKQMAPEHLLATFAKLCAEILAAATDGMLNIEDATGQSVIQDAFQILSSKEMRLSCSRASTAETADLDDGGDGATAAAAKGRAITQAVRKGLIQNTIPIFIELKRLLESKNSPLIGSLMECLRALLKDYKNEIDDILVADKQLQKELIYDMQKFELAKARSTANEAIATMRNPNTFRSPGFYTTANKERNHDKVDEGFQADSRVASAMADAAAASIARSVLKEVNKGVFSPARSSRVPKLKSAQDGICSQSSRPLDVLESVRRKPSTMFDDENGA